MAQHRVDAIRTSQHVLIADGSIGEMLLSVREAGGSEHPRAPWVTVSPDDLLRAVVADRLPAVEWHPEQGGYVEVAAVNGAPPITQVAPPANSEAYHIGVALQHLALAEYARTHPPIDPDDLRVLGLAVEQAQQVSDPRGDPVSIAWNLLRAGRVDVKR